MEYTFRPFIPQEEPASPLALAGWALLLSTLVSVIPIFVSPQWIDPEWQVRVMNQCAEVAMLPLLSIALVLHGRPLTVTWRRLKQLRLLVGLSLLLGLFYMAMVPLTTRDNMLITRKLQARMAMASSSQSQRTDKVLKALVKAQSVQDVKMLGAMLSLAPELEQFHASQPDIGLEELRDWIQNRVYASEQAQHQMLHDTGEKTRIQVLRDTAKLIAMAFVAGFFYLVLFLRNRNVFQKHGIWPLPPTREF